MATAAGNLFQTVGQVRDMGAGLQVKGQLATAAMRTNIEHNKSIF
jgi:hypothetical protein